jgi:hypothetical protein
MHLGTEVCAVKYDIANCYAATYNFILSEMGNKRFFHTILVIAWLLFGTFASMYIWDANWYEGFYFAIDAISVAGVDPPFCQDATLNDDCILTSYESIFTGTYIIVGVPLFALFMVSIAEAIIERSIRVKERNSEKVHKLLSENEFKEAISFYGSAVSKVRSYSDTDEKLPLTTTFFGGTPKKRQSFLVVKGDVR